MIENDGYENLFESLYDCKIKADIMTDKYTDIDQHVNNYDYIENSYFP